MPNIKISAATDAGTLLSNDMLPLARSGDTNAYHATMAEIASFASVTASSGAYGNTGRNLVHNPMFNVQSRGTSFTASGYTADRWQLDLIADTSTVALVAATDVMRTAIGDEAVNTVMSVSVNGTAGATAYTIIAQPIEFVHRLSGKTVTVGFWASTSIAMRIGVNLLQNFGTGGTPSASVWATPVTVNATTTWTRYSATFAVPTAVGKTLGTNVNDYTSLAFWLSSGSTNAAIAGNPGVQTGVVNLWGVQLEVGGVATPLEKIDTQDDARHCLRFYWGDATFFAQGYGVANTEMAIGLSLPAPMRATPTLTVDSVNNTNLGSAVIAGSTPYLVYAQATVLADGGWILAIDATVSADL